MRKRNEIDMTNGPMFKQVLLYALPIAATAILQQLYNAADVAVVGHYVGEVAMAAVGANTSLVHMMVNIFIGLALGANVVIAFSVGSGNKEAIHKAVHSSILMAVISGLIVCAVAEILSVPIMHMLSVPDDVFPMALLYFRVYMFGIPFAILYNFEAAFFRSIGDTRTPLVVLSLSGLVNVILNLIFVLVLHRGADGVALATVSANIISSTTLFIKLCHSDAEIRVRKEEMRIDGKILVRIVRIGLPSALQSAVFSCANIMIQTAINSLGTIIMAASSAASNIEAGCYSILNSFSQACTTFVGQNNGAQKMDRCRKAFVVCLIEAFCAAGIAVGVVLSVGKPLLSIFNDNPMVIEVGYQRMLILFGSYIFSMQYEMVSGYMRGFGRSTLPSLLTLFGIVSVRVTFVYVIFPQYRTFKAIMMAYPFSLSFTAVLLYIALFTIRPSRRQEITLKHPKE